MQLEPNFFIVGAAKSGTTSLASYLGQHPNIFMPHAYMEPAFFADGTGDCAIEEYLSHFVSEKKINVVGEKSVAYLFDPQAAKRIHAYNRNAKIVIVLREHVDMAYSFYLHNKREGLEPLQSFEEALSAEDKRFIDEDFSGGVLGYHGNFFYRRRATYVPQINRYLDVFPRGQIQILTFEDLKQNPVLVSQKLYRWLGVDDQLIPNVRAENRGGTMRMQWVQDLYMQKAWVRHFARLVTPYRLRKMVYNWNRVHSGSDQIENDLRLALNPLFEEDKKTLAKSFGITFSKAA